MPKKTEIAATPPESMKIDEALKFLVRLANTDVDDLKSRLDDPDGLPTILYLLRRYLDVSEEAQLRSGLDAVRSRPDKLKRAITDVRRLLAAALEGSLGDTEFTFTKARKIRLVLRDG